MGEGCVFSSLAQVAEFVVYFCRSAKKNKDIDEYEISLPGWFIDLFSSFVSCLLNTLTT